MIMGKFSISINGNAFKDTHVTKDVIKKIIDYVIKENQCGNYEFFTLVNNESGDFIQFTLEGSECHLEVRYLHTGAEKGIYVKTITNYEKTIESFYDFYEKKMIDTEGFEDISYYLN